MPTIRGFQTPAKRLQHFTKHGATFGCVSEAVYEAKAVAFFARVDPGIRVARRPSDNAVLYYDYQTNEFGVVTRAGHIKTYFKPTTATHRLPRNLDYYFAESVRIQ